VTNVADVGVTNVAPANVVAGTVYTNVIEVTNAGPSVATNVVVLDVLPGGGTTNVTVAVLPAGGETNIYVVEVAPGSGPVTNVASATPGTYDPNLGNNTNAAVTAVTPSGPVADVQVFVSGPTNVTVGDGFSYTILVTNAGPNTAISTLVTNLLPTNLVFASASGGGVNTNNIVTWPVIPSLTNGQATNLILTVTPLAGVSTVTTNTNPFNFVETNTTPSVGFLTNKASAFAATFDPNLTNNSASSAYTNAQVQTVIVPGVFSVFLSTNTYPTNFDLTKTIIPVPGSPGLFIVGTSAWNPETELYEETVSVTNNGTAPVQHLRVYVTGLRNGVTLYNATGTDSKGQYVEYDPLMPLANTPPNNSVTFLLEFYVANGQPFTNLLTAVASQETPVASVIGAVLLTNVVLAIHVADPVSPNPRFLIQFPSISGRTYTIEYSPDLVNWYIAKPSIVAVSTATLWYDDGPPETLSRPFTLVVPQRYYRIFLDP
jgi:uncharacterized repeat protein (TIGR01451 family)